jgi:protein TonB
MQLMIASGEQALTEARSFHAVDFVRVERAQTVETKEAKPERPPQPEMRPEVPTPQFDSQFDAQVAVSIPAPAIESGAPSSNVSFGVSDGEYLPIVKVVPVYPQRALMRRLEGYVVVEFVVTRTGNVRDVVVVESTAEIFEPPAVEAALKFRYKPRVIDGEAVEVAGVRNRLTFTMAGSVSETRGG